MSGQQQNQWPNEDQLLKEVYDLERPTAKPGELVCDGCWLVSADKRSWSFFQFKTLASQNFCPICTQLEAIKMAQLQEAGL